MHYNKYDPVQLFLDNERLVGYSIKHWVAEYPSLEEDMIGEGRIALWRACLGFNPKKGYKFSTYAVRVIRSRVEKHVLIYTKREMRSKFKTVSYNAHMSEGETYENVLLVDNTMEDVIENIEIKKVIEDFAKSHPEWLIVKVMGYSGAEAGRILGVSPNTSRWKVREQNKKLQEILKRVM